MKVRLTIFTKVILFVMIATFTLTVATPVKALANSTTLTTNVPKTISLLLEITGNGTVTINGEVYTQSSKIGIPENSDIVLHINPKEKNYIKSVSCNGNNLTYKVKKGELLITDIVEKTKLCIVFSEFPATPTTGDFQYYTLPYFVLLMMVSLIGIISLLLFKKNNTP